MHVAEAGSGPPLLLVHGWPQNWFLTVSWSIRFRYRVGRFGSD
jgi:pimeloyl-ACP methyl ester carboxylesterase